MYLLLVLEPKVSASPLSLKCTGPVGKSTQSTVYFVLVTVTVPSVPCAGRYLVPDTLVQTWTLEHIWHSGKQHGN